jgi:hypothetical protein
MLFRKKHWQKTAFNKSSGKTYFLEKSAFNKSSGKTYFLEKSNIKNCFYITVYFK